MAELSKENEQLRPITNLSSESEKVGWCENSMSAEIHIHEENDFTALKYVFIFFSILDCIYVHPNMQYPKCYFFYLFKFLVFFLFSLIF